jgi:hypothetical protein
MSTLALPTEAVIIAFDPRDGLGTLRTPDGTEVRFGHSACIGFMPEQGMTVWLVETKPDPLGRGERAKVVNRSGHVEKDRLTQIEEEHTESDARYELEVALLDRLGLPETPEPADYEALSHEDRVRLAEEVMALRRTSHLLDEPFSMLAELDPSLLHPYLDELSPEHDVEALAWTNAPVSALPRLMASLRTDWHAERGDGVEPGDPVAAAAVALARSGQPEALRALEAWVGALGEKKDRQGALNLLLGVNVVQTSSGTLLRNYTPACLEVLPKKKARAKAAVATGTLWNPLPGTMCLRCYSPLVDALQADGDASEHGLPWPGRLPTCFSCIARGGTVHVKLHPDGTVESVGSDKVSDVARDVKPPAPRKVKLGRGPIQRSMMLSEQEQRHRLGGAPSWSDFPEVRQCPDCREPMHAAGQAADVDAGFSDAGMLYGVACERCRVLTTFSST